MKNYDQEMYNEEKLFLREKWKKGIRVSFRREAKPEPIERDDFYGASWVDLEPEIEAEIKSNPFQLNGVWRRALVAGWQCLDNGLAVLHPEKVQEDMNLASGRMLMAKVGRDRHCGIQEVSSPIPESELWKINFSLAITDCYDGLEYTASQVGLEYMALHVLANIDMPLPQLSIQPGESHSTVSPGKSWYFVLKHSPIEVR